MFLEIVSKDYVKEFDKYKRLCVLYISMVTINHGPLHNLGPTTLVKPKSYVPFAYLLSQLFFFRVLFL